MMPILRAGCFPALLVCCACASMNSSSGIPTTTAQDGPAQVGNAKPGVIPAGQELDVRLGTTLSSDRATVEQRFQATTAVDLMQDGRVLVPAGSVVDGLVSGVDAAGRVDRTGSLALAFDQLVANGREYSIRATATKVFESKGIRGEARTIGAAGGIGAIVGGIIGGLDGAVLGAIVGGGGVIAATEGKDVTLPAGTIIRIRLNAPVEIR